MPEKPGAAHRWKDQHSVQGLVSGGGGGGVWACVGWACEETWGMGGWACGETQGTVNGRKKMAALEINLASNSVFMTLVV